MQLGHRIAYDVTFATIALISASLRLWIRYGVTSRKYTTHTIAAGTATTTTITAGRGRSTKRRRLKSYYIGDAFLVLGLFLTLAFAVRNVQLEATVLKQRSPPKDVWLLQPWLLKIQEAGKVSLALPYASVMRDGGWRWGLRG